MYVLHTVLTITGGQLLYQTYLQLDRTQGLCFGAGVVVSILGVYILAHAPADDEEDVDWIDDAALELDRSIVVDHAESNVSAGRTVSSRAEQTPPRLELNYDSDDTQVWIQVDEEFETALAISDSQRDERADAEVVDLTESTTAACDDSGSSWPRPGSAPRLTTTRSLRTASPEYDFHDQAPESDQLRQDGEEPSVDQLVLQLDDGDGVENGSSAGDDVVSNGEREGRRQRGHHRRVRSFSSSPRERSSGRRSEQRRSNKSSQGHSPARVVKYMLVSNSGQGTPQSVSSLSRTRPAPSPGAVDLSLWRWSHRAVPTRGSRSMSSPATLPATARASMRSRLTSLADPVEVPALSPATTVSENTDEAVGEALHSGSDGRRLFGDGQSSDETSRNTVGTEQHARDESVE